MNAPENSLSAIRRAAAAGLPIELDVRLAADSVLIVSHDSNLERMTGHRGTLETLPATALRTLRLGESGEPIPLLDEAIRLCRGSVPLLIEAKVRGNCDDLLRALDEIDLPTDGACALQSFHPAFVRSARRRFPHLPVGLLAGPLRDEPLRPWTRWIVRHLLAAAWCRPHFIGYDVTALPALCARVARRLGVPVLAWTVRTAAERERAELYADNIIFERAPWTR